MSRSLPRPLLRVAALTAAVVLAAVPAGAASAHDGSPNGLDRVAVDAPGPATPEAEAALADFQRRAALGEFARVAADDPTVGPGYVSSSNVTYVGTIPQTTDGVGARVVKNRLFVTSTKDLQVFDITNPTIPTRLGSISVNVEFENEQVPTDGKVLGISGQTPTVNAAGVCPGNVSLGCVALFDVRGKGAPVLVQTVPSVGDHTQTCLDYEGETCAFMFGSSGNVVDLRGFSAASRVPATKAAFNWQTVVRANNGGVALPLASGHHQTQIRPGVLMTASRPQYLISINAADGGSPSMPKVLGSANFAGAPDDKSRFTHSTEWARGGKDSILLTGGETNFQPTCGATNGAFSTFVVSGDPLVNPTFTFADQVRPKEGNFLDGNPPPGSFKLGCSVHWFEPRQDFRDGGIVAMASYENGTKFLDISSTGKISEVGFFLPLGGSTSAPHWASDGKTVYLVDYTRGLDIVTFADPVVGPTPVVPEAPLALLLPLGALVAGASVLRRRRGAIA